MIKIQIIKEYKSIKPCSFELPNFSVLTGLNGSGKTHLIEAISKKEHSVIMLNNKKLTNIRYIPFNGLNSTIEEECNPSIVSDHIKKFYDEFRQVLKRFPNQQVRTDQMTAFSSDLNFKKHAKTLYNKIGKNLQDITEADIANNFDVEYISKNDFFTGEFALIFKNYHVLLEENNINKYYLEKGLPINNPILSDQDFEQRNGQAPWIFVNNILQEISAQYRVNSPVGTRKEMTFSFRLVDKDTGIEVRSQDLSTGEKVLMSLALAIYNTKGDNNKPELLLIDEPDAALHPSMSRKMVNVLDKNIVQESNIPSIITSHSPTTIISCEGISIYQMERGNSIPNKISVQKAVELLSSDIPFLKISNESRRQVFVESKYDVKYYEQLTNIFSRLETLNSEPLFLPARTSNGSNCSDVIEVVNTLFEHGNDQIYGIVDWDKVNKDNGRIIVLGNEERYSIENYLLDPLLMGLLFIREAKIPIQNFNLTNISSYSQLHSLDHADAQKIIDIVLVTLGLMSANMLDYKLYGGLQLKISQEFNLLQGHDLESLYKIKYPFLNSYQREDSLKSDIILKIINDYPQFTPNAIFDTVMKIK